MGSASAPAQTTIVDKRDSEDRQAPSEPSGSRVTETLQLHDDGACKVQYNIYPIDARALGASIHRAGTLPARFLLCVTFQPLSSSLLCFCLFSMWNKYGTGRGRAGLSSYPRSVACLCLVVSVRDSSQSQTSSMGVGGCVLLISTSFTFRTLIMKPAAIPARHTNLHTLPAFSCTAPFYPHFYRLNAHPPKSSSPTPTPVSLNTKGHIKRRCSSPFSPRRQSRSWHSLLTLLVCPLLTSTLVLLL